MRSTPREPELRAWWQRVGLSSGEPALRRVHLVTNPADDDDFRRFACDSLSGDPRLSDFHASLRARYPKVVIHERMLSGEPTSIWYCYRDGHWVGPTAHRANDT